VVVEVAFNSPEETAKMLKILGLRKRICPQQNC